MKRMRHERVKPLLNLHGEWKPGCKYPTTLYITMDDGRVMRYSLEAHPERIHAGEDPGRVTVGYQYKETARCW